MLKSIYNKETSERISNPMPVYIYEVHKRPNVLGKKIDIPPHWHTEFEVILTFCNGTSIINGNEHKVKPGDIILIPSESLHSCKCNDIGQLYAITIDPIFFDFKIADKSQIKYGIPFLKNTLLFDNYIDTSMPNYDKILHSINQILNGINNAESSILIKSYTFHLLALIITYYSIDNLVSIADSNIIDVLKKSLDIIYNNYLSPLSLDTISHDIGMSKFSFIRYFSKMFNKTPTEYIINLRLQNAYDMLIRDNNVTDACFNSGFNNLSYFIRKFKTVYGITPHQVKKNCD